MTTTEDEDTDAHIAKIANALMGGRIGFLIGAGMSIPSGSTSGQQLAFELVWKSIFPQKREPLTDEFKESLGSVVAKFPLEALAAAVAPLLPQQTFDLEQMVQRVVFKGKTPKTHEGHRALASLVTKFNLRNLYTTNWDNLLVDAIGDGAAEAVTEARLPQIEELYAKGKTAVVHLHGTFKDSPLISERDLMDPERPLLQLFMAELQTKPFVFVGYSLGDPNIRALYSKANQILARRSDRLKKLTYIVDFSTDPVERSVAAKVWAAREAIYLHMGGEDFFRRLVLEATTNALQELKDKLVERLKTTHTDLAAKVTEIMNVFPGFESPEQVLRYIEAITRSAA